MHSLLVFLTLIGATLATLRAEPLQTEANVPVEITFTAGRPHADPFHDVILDVRFVDPAGTARTVPAFWAGNDRWKVRYASPLIGSHHWETICNDPADTGLHAREGDLKVSSYTGSNPLFQHGPIRVAVDARHFEYADGTPFFWLGDTWWMGLCYRLHWPDEFQHLTADRKAKGFNVVQIVAGLYPDMHPFDPRGANEAGYPWEKDYARVRPEYFDAADARLQHLVDQGITPCIVGAWGYFLPWMGVEKMNAHWRYLIARYGSWPVVWCAAGEANLPWYLAKGFPYDDREQVHGWTEVLRFIRKTDPFHRPLTIHPTAIRRYTARHATDDAAFLDFDMLQTPHGQLEAAVVTERATRESFTADPKMPVIDGEASYEKLSDRLPTEWTRAMFWICMMNGTAGHTYGANGIWQCNRPGRPHGASPNGTGNGYGVITWEEAMNLPGSSQLAAGKRFFESLPWTKLIPMPGSVSWDSTEEVPLGDWVWFPEGDPKVNAPIASRYFRRTFDLTGKPSVAHATLRATADDKSDVYVNGKHLASSSDWHAPITVDLSGLISNGKNTLALRAENVASGVTQNPAGLAAVVTITFTDGTTETVRSDTAWRSSNSEQKGWHEADFDDSTWSSAQFVAKFGEGPWGPIGNSKSSFAPQACGIGDSLRVIYALNPKPILVRNLRPGASYRATHFDPTTGERTPPTPAIASAEGIWRCEPPGYGHDWVLLLEAQP